MKHIFGPVNSRRLGRSLGVDLFADKVCNYNCVYCEIGKASILSADRQAYTPVSTIVAEITDYFADPDHQGEQDVVTVTASGEPTLHSGLGEILNSLRSNWPGPIAVLTNGSTLCLPEVRREIALADVVIPSLDSARQESFRKINRPGSTPALDSIIDGLLVFGREFNGAIWLEILFVAGFNDSEGDLAALAEVLSKLQPDRVQLNTVARPPLESFAQPVNEEGMQYIKDYFKKLLPDITVELPVWQATGDGRENEVTTIRRAGLDDAVIRTLRRRPCTAQDLNTIFRLGGSDKVEQLLETLITRKTILKKSHRDTVYYQAVESERCSCNQVK
jgi:wyosine [tRNA(Phe)-imidazoG37] synthetase (radical SAM superfamily)